MKCLRSVRMLACAALVVSAAASAHHSTAAFDYTKTVTLKGVIRNFQWTNPHCYIQLLVTDAGGAQKEWSIETGTPSLGLSQGWTKNSVKPGDKVTALISPLRDGTSAGTLRKLTLPNGKVLLGAAANVGTDKAGTPDLVPALPDLQPATPKQP